MKKAILSCLFFGCFCLVGGCAPRRAPHPKPTPAPKPAPTQAPAQKAHGGGQGFMDKHDHNHDGRVTRAEFPGPDHVFAQLDSNNDGFITGTEAPKQRPNHSPEGQGHPPQGQQQNKRHDEGFIEKFDNNHDGRVTRAEFPGPDHVFAQLDRNNDGFITGAEAPKQRQHNSPKGQGHPPQGQQKNKKHDEGFIEKFDHNHDGRVNRAEFPGPDHVFAQLDRDNDGFITGPEAPAGGPPSHGQRKNQKHNGQGFIANFDKDHDGRVTRAEFPGPDHVFAQFDRNTDGFIDASEAPGQPANSRGHR